MIAANTIYDALYAVAAGDAGVLALVNSNSIFHRKQLSNTTGRVLPWLVWATDVRDGDRGEMSAVYCDWYIYVAPNAVAAERDLHTIADAVQAAYANPFAVSWGRITIGRRGKPFFDKAVFDFQGLRIPLAYRALG
jgi:hypothetical protein